MTEGITTDSRPNAQTAIDFLFANLKSDGDRARACLHPDAVFHFPRSALPIVSKVIDVDGPAFQGSEQVMQSIEMAMGQLYDNPTAEVLQVIVDGDMVVLLFHLRTTLYNGEYYDNLYSDHFRFKDGKIIERWEFLDTAHAFERFPSVS
jgi:ketosteroid isomerase-like protein